EGSSDWTADPGTMDFLIKVRKDQSLDKVRDKAIEIVEGVAKTTIGKDEVDRWRVKTLKEIDLALTSSQRIGIELTEWAAVGDCGLFFLHAGRAQAVTADDVRKVAANYLKGSNRTVGLFIPEKTPDRSPLPQTPDVKALVKDYKGQKAMSEGEAFAA